MANNGISDRCYMEEMSDFFERAKVSDQTEGGRGEVLKKVNVELYKLEVEMNDYDQDKIMIMLVHKNVISY